MGRQSEECRWGARPPPSSPEDVAGVADVWGQSCPGPIPGRRQPVPQSLPSSQVRVFKAPACPPAPEPREPGPSLCLGLKAPPSFLRFTVKHLELQRCIYWSATRCPRGTSWRLDTGQVSKCRYGGTPGGGPAVRSVHRAHTCQQDTHSHTSPWRDPPVLWGGRGSVLGRARRGGTGCTWLPCALLTHICRVILSRGMPASLPSSCPFYG